MRALAYGYDTLYSYTGLPLLKVFYCNCMHRLCSIFTGCTLDEENSSYFFFYVKAD